MTPMQLSALLVELLGFPQETEWIEWKHNHAEPESIAEYVSALANSAALHNQERAYLIWGIEDGSKTLLGTTFRPRQAKKGNEELENWLMRSLHPQVNLRIHEWQHEEKSIVLFEIPRATHAPVRFGSEEFIRVGSLKKKLKEYPAKEAELWASFSKNPFEQGIAKPDVGADDVVKLLDFDKCFELLGIPLPPTQQGIIDRMAQENLLVPRPGQRFDITNLGAILFARTLHAFHRLSRKAFRVIIYQGANRVETLKEQCGEKGYAIGFAGAIRYINDQLPQNEQIGQALRTTVRTYPELAVRELVANALIHQDFSVTGAGPTVEIFSDRMEITNPGRPLIDPLRFIDEPPRSRNEGLAATMRRAHICEERGSGIDKVVSQVEAFQLPAPDFRVTDGSTVAILYGPRGFSQMDRVERIRACYQHACLWHVSGKRMTNSSLRQRLGIKDSNYPMASRIIRDAAEANLIRPYSKGSDSKKDASYVPFWA